MPRRLRALLQFLACRSLLLESLPLAKSKRGLVCIFAAWPIRDYRRVAVFRGQDFALALRAERQQQLQWSLLIGWSGREIDTFKGRPQGCAVALPVEAICLHAERVREDRTRSRTGEGRTRQREQKMADSRGQDRFAPDDSDRG